MHNEDFVVHATEQTHKAWKAMATEPLQSDRLHEHVTPETWGNLGDVLILHILFRLDRLVDRAVATFPKQCAKLKSIRQSWQLIWPDEAEQCQTQAEHTLVSMLSDTPMSAKLCFLCQV